MPYLTMINITSDPPIIISYTYPAKVSKKLESINFQNLRRLGKILIIKKNREATLLVLY